MEPLSNGHPTTNFEKWRAYNSGISSPQSFIDWGFYWMIAACLQRRVWVGPKGQELYPNMYCILVGPPGIGKGLALKEVEEFVRHWKLADVMSRLKGEKSTDDKMQMQMTAQADLDNANKAEFQGTSNKQNKDIIPPGLFHVAADSTSYQALILAIGECYRSINYYMFDHVKQKDELITYRHSSTCFILKELASLMREKTQDTVNFLLGLYDCPLDYEYRTVSRERDRIRRGCVNIIGGTTPSYMQNTFDSRIMDEGFSSRCFYIFANKNRVNRCFIPARTPLQEQYKKDILEHLFNLSQLCGPIELEDGVYEWLEEWWNRFENDKSIRSNKSPKLRAYYARRNIHTIKMALAMHFGESVLKKVPLQRFIDADKFLAEEEKNMHLALVLEGNSPESKAMRNIFDMLNGGAKTRLDVYIETFKIIGSKGKSEEVIDFLLETGQIVPDTVTDESKDKSTLYYKLK